MIYDDFHYEDCINLYKKFLKEKDVFYSVPTIEQIEEVNLLLDSDGGFIYVRNFADGEMKTNYWKNVLEIYKNNKFVFPYSHGFNYERNVMDIEKYHVTSNVIFLIENICKKLEDITNECFAMEHVSYN